MSTRVREAMAPELRERIEASAQEVGNLCAQYEERYGLKDLEAWQVRRIQQAERELEQCKTCAGDCREMGYTQPVIEKTNESGVPYVLCKWGRLNRFRRACRGGKLPDKYAGKTFKDYEVTADNERAVGYAKWHCQKQPAQGLYLHGACGTGKTFLATLIAKAYIGRFKTVIFGDVPALMEEIKATFDGVGSREAVLRGFTSCELLVLDDLGAGYVTDWTVATLYQIINARYNSNLPLIVTANFSPEELLERLGGKDKYAAQRLHSRLTEMCVPLSLGNVDRRLRNEMRKV